MRKAIIVPSVALTVFAAGAASATDMIGTGSDKVGQPPSRAMSDRSPAPPFRLGMLAALSNQDEQRIPERLEEPDCEQTQDCEPILDNRTEAERERDRIVDPAVAQEQDKDRIIDPPEKTDQDRDRRLDKPIEPGVA